MLTLVAAIIRRSGWLLLSFLVVLGLLVVVADLPAKLGEARQYAANLRNVSKGLSDNAEAFEGDARAGAAAGAVELTRLREAGLADLDRAKPTLSGAVS
jgi:hypothetical protein